MQVGFRRRKMTIYNSKSRRNWYISRAQKNLKVFDTGVSSMAPQDFGRLVKPISTRVGKLCPPNNTATPRFLILPSSYGLGQIGIQGSPFCVIFRQLSPLSDSLTTIYFGWATMMPFASIYRTNQRTNISQGKIFLRREKKLRAIVVFLTSDS